MLQSKYLGIQYTHKRYFYWDARLCNKKLCVHVSSSSQQSKSEYERLLARGWSMDEADSRCFSLDPILILYISLLQEAGSDQRSCVARVWSGSRSCDTVWQGRWLDWDWLPLRAWAEPGLTNCSSRQQKRSTSSLMAQLTAAGHLVSWRQLEAAAGSCWMDPGLCSEPELATHNHCIVSRHQPGRVTHGRSSFSAESLFRAPTHWQPVSPIHFNLELQL